MRNLLAQGIVSRLPNYQAVAISSGASTFCGFL
jgi:hypothetical protein